MAVDHAETHVVLLLCEPDPALAAQVVRVLNGGFLRVESCPTADELLYLTGRLRPGLVLMRAALPGADAARVIATVRLRDEMPIVISVGPGETTLAGPALLAGASGLTEHPYRDRALKELVPRHLHVIETRMRLAATVAVGSLVLDGAAYTAWLDGRPLVLPRLEFDILHLLVDRAGRVVTFGEIHDLVWGPRGESASRQTLSVHMSRVRERIAQVAEIAAIRGVGYRLSAL